MKNTFIFAIAIILAGGSGFILQRYLAENTVSTLTSRTSMARPDFAMKDLDGKLRDIKEWDGKIIILNFWATWCPPCLKEIPDLIKLQNLYGQQGLQIIGIAIDNDDDVRAFIKKTGINYPVMASQQAGELAGLYGNKIGGLPYTAIINRDGEITETIIGVLHMQRAEKILSALGLSI